MKKSNRSLKAKRDEIFYLSPIRCVARDGAFKAYRMVNGGWSQIPGAVYQTCEECNQMQNTTGCS